MPEMYLYTNYLDSNNKVTLADVSLVLVDDDGNEIYTKSTKGVALRNIGDKADDTIGAQLALGRALENLGARLQKAAWGKVEHNDNMRGESAKAKSPEALARKEEWKRKKISKAVKKIKEARG